MTAGCPNRQRRHTPSSWTTPNPDTTLLGLYFQQPARVKRAEVMFNPVTAPYGTSYLHSAESAALSFGVDVTGAPIRDDADIKRIITALGGEQGGSLIVVPDTFTDVHRDLIIALIAQHRLPAVYPYTHFAESGGLMAYGSDPAHMFGRTADYVDRIFRGAKPADLPV